MNSKPTKPFYVILISLICFLTIQAQDKISFIENKGQWNENIFYKSSLNFGEINFEKDNFTFILIENIDHHHDLDVEVDHQEIQGHHFKIKFLNSNNDVTFSTENKSGNYYNYFLGNDRDKWASYVHSYKAITYHNLYDGIDMKVKGSVDNMKYEYYVQPFSNPNDIEVQYIGLNDISLQNGNLVYETKIAGITELKPIVYQIINDEKVFISCEYKLDKKYKKVKFKLLEEYDSSLELIIDPTLIFASYSSATLNNFGFTATFDNDENLYGGGIIFFSGSSNFSGTIGGYPSINSFNIVDSTYGGSTGYFSGFPADMAISKFSSDGTTLLYSTIIGGSLNEQPQSLVTDSLGNLYIYGRSYSPNFPVTVNSFDTSHNGNSDIVVLKISPDGGTLLGSTFIGGADDDGVNMFSHPSIRGNNYAQLKNNYADDGRGEIIIGANNTVYVTSTTKSHDIFSTTTSFQDTLASHDSDISTPGFQDACIFKLNEDLTSMVWGSYLGGSNNDAGYSLKIDHIGNVFVAGGTNSIDFPGTTGGFNSVFNGGKADGFLAKIDTNGSILYQSTYLGTPAYDQSYFVEIDEFNDIYTYGQTNGNYLVTSDVYSNPNSSQYIHKLNNNLNTTIFSTVFGDGIDKVNISPTAFLVDNCLNIYISGWGGGTNIGSNGITIGNTIGLPITDDAFQSTTDGQDFYFMVLAKDAESLLYATYYGGNQNVTGGSGEHVDGGTSRFDKNGVIYQAVCASCGAPNDNFPTTGGSWSEIDSSSSGCNLGVIKMDIYIPPTIISVDASPTATGCVPLTVNFESDLINVNLIDWDFDDGTTSNIEDPVHVFTDTGTYTIRLIGEDTTLCNLKDTAYLTVVVKDDSLIANFIDNSIINCHNNSISVASHNYATTEYLWDMDDGNTFTSDSVFHQYLNPGTYNIKLILSDTSSCELVDSMETSIIILPTINTSFSLSDTFGCTDLQVNFTNQTNIVVDSLFWSFGDGNTSNLLNPSNTYSTVGGFDVQLIAFDTNTCNQIDTILTTISTVNDRIEALIQVDTIFYECDSLLLRFSSLNANATNHMWDFDIANPSSSTDSTVVVTFTEGNFNVNYYIEDTNFICKPLDTLDFSILLLPEIKVNFALSDTFGCTDFIVNFTNQTNIVVDSLFWSFGDGNTSNSLNPSNTYSTVGGFDVQLIAFDTNTCNLSDTISTSISTINDSIEAQIQIDTILFECDSLIMRFSSLNANVNHLWNFASAVPAISLDSTVLVTFTTGIYNGNYFIEDTNIICMPFDTIDFSITVLPKIEIQANISDTIGCVPFAVNFNALVSVPVDSTVWVFGNGDFSTNNNLNYIYNSLGNYNASFYAIDSNTCNIADSIMFEIMVINDSAIADIVIVDHLFNCDSLQVEVHSNTLLAVHYWDFGDGFTSFEQTTTHTYQNYGTYNISYVLYDSTKICYPYDTVNFPITFENIEAVIQLSDTLGCVPFLLNYNTNTIADFYQWDFGNIGTSNSSSGNFTFNNIGVYDISLIVIDSSTCNIIDSISSQITTEDSRVIADFNYTILNSCDSLLSIQLNNTSLDATDNIWLFDGTNSLATEEPGIYNFNTIGNHSITLVVENNLLCHPTDTIIADFELLPNTKAIFQVVDNCVNKTIELSNNSVEANSYIWTSGNGKASNLFNPIFSYDESGMYFISLIVIDSTTCNIIDSTKHSINIIDQSVANFITDSSYYMYPDPVSFTNLSENYTEFIWNYGNGMSENIEENPIYNYSSFNDIEPCLTVWNEYCGDTTCQNIFIDFIELIGVPNAFSPNGDGINDIIFVEGLGISSLSFNIYNRWGQIVFESTDKNKGWDGTFNGVLQEMEVYTYSVYVIFLNNEKANIKGNITLLR